MKSDRLIPHVLSTVLILACFFLVSVPIVFAEEDLGVDPDVLCSLELEQWSDLLADHCVREGGRVSRGCVEAFEPVAGACGLSERAFDFVRREATRPSDPDGLAGIVTALVDFAEDDF